VSQRTWLYEPAAGKESAIAIYDIGELQFLYVTHLPSGNFLQSTLWQSRNKFQSRHRRGVQFFTRSDPESSAWLRLPWQVTI